MNRILLLLLLASSTAFAKPVIVKEAGKLVTATWPSGNEAQLQTFMGEVLDTTVDFKVSESSCNSVTGQKLTFHFPASANLMLWIWTKHSDPKKVGRNLMKGNQSLADAFFFSNGTGFRFPEMSKNFPKDRLEPADLSFIPGLEGPFHSFNIDFWFSETMFRSPETGVMENRISFSGSGIQLGDDGNILSFESASEMGAGGNALALIGDVVTWIVTTEKGTCQVSFKPDTGPAQQKLIAYLSSIRGPFKPYIWKSDDLTTIIEETRGTPVRDSMVEEADE